MDVCKNCGERSVIFDSSSGTRLCNSCGAEQPGDVFQYQAFDSTGRATGSFVHSVGDYSYRERKVYHADAQINSLTTRLGLSATRAAEIRRMVSDVTDGCFGAGKWFPVLVAACAYITMRQNRLPLPIAEAAAEVGRDVHELGRMVGRVVEYLGIEPLPEFDIFQSLERTVRTCPSLVGVEEDKAEEILKQGRFLLQCAVKWFLTTGRQPLPLVAAVVAFVAELNGMEVQVEEIVKETYAGVATSRLRKKALLETLVKVAKALLPWGEDVTVKNIIHNAPPLLRYMEMKSKSGTLDAEQFGFGLYGSFDGYLDSEKEDSKYFDVGSGVGSQDMSRDELGRLKLLAECLSIAYKKALETGDLVKSSGEFAKSHSRKKKTQGNLLEAHMGLVSG